MNNNLQLNIKTNIFDNKHTDIKLANEYANLGGDENFKNVFLNTKSHTYFIDTNVNGGNISGSHNFFGDGNAASGGLTQV